MPGSTVLAALEVEDLAAENLVFRAQVADFAFQGAQPVCGDGELGAERVRAGRVASGPGLAGLRPGGGAVLADLAGQLGLLVEVTEADLGLCSNCGEGVARRI